MNLSTASKSVALLWVVLLFGTLDRCQAQKQPDCITVSDKCDLHATVANVAAPDAPAITVLGLSPTNISKPTSPAEFATDLLNAFDDNGHFQSGVALDAVPYLVFWGRSYSLGQYANKGPRAYFIRLFSRSSVSFATVKGTSSPDTSTRLSTGFRVSLFDLNDPRAAFHKCVSEIDVVPDPDNLDAAAKVQSKLIKDCRAAKRAWNSTSLVIAGAPTWISNDGVTTSLKTNGAGYWVSYSQGIQDWGQLIMNGRRVTGAHVAPQGASGSAPFVIQDTSVFGGAFRAGRSDINAIFEGLYIGKKTAGVPDSYPEFGVGLEKKLASNLYLDVNYRYDVNSKVSTSGVLANLKWSFNKQSQMTQ
jgi:hypothetical protein